MGQPAHTRRTRSTFARLAAVAATAMLTGGLLTSCWNAAAKSLDYAVDGRVMSYNANTVAGNASAAAQAFGRVLTGFGYHGPDGQVIGDSDFGTVQLVGRIPQVLDYTISDGAVYSDGKPVTCDDMVLAWYAQSGRMPEFNAARTAGYADISTVDCKPGAKTARVTFAPDRAFTDWNQLFTATSMMPWHVIADQTDGVDIVAAIAGNDVPTLQKIADFWNNGWNLAPDLDLSKFPSSGPYKLGEYHEDGSLLLVANDKWWGQPPITKRITVWPSGIDIQKRLADGELDVVDVAAGSAGSLAAPDGYVRTEASSSGVEQLIFGGTDGSVGIPDLRRAVALCVPRDVIAANAGLPPMNARLDTTVGDSFTGVEAAAEAGRFEQSDPVAAKAAAGGHPLTVRVGYQAPNPRRAAIVAAMAQACAPADIRIEDASSPAIGPQALRDGAVDALLSSIGGAPGNGSTGSWLMDAYSLRSGEGVNPANYANGQIDGIIAALAVTTNARDQSRLLSDASAILWNDLPSLPLYRQSRVLITPKAMYATTPGVTRWGSGWNMDRWALPR